MEVDGSDGVPDFNRVIFRFKIPSFSVVGNHHFESCKTNSLQGTSPYPTLGKRKSSNQKCRLVVSSLEGIMPNYLNKHLSP